MCKVMELCAVCLPYLGDFDFDRDLDLDRLLLDRFLSLDLDRDRDLDLERDLPRDLERDLDRPLGDLERDLERDRESRPFSLESSSFLPCTSYPSYFSMARSRSVRLANSTTLKNVAIMF